MTYQTNDDHTLDCEKHALEGGSVKVKFGLCLKRTYNPSVSLVHKDHVLNAEWDKRFDSAGSNRLDAPRTKMRAQRSRVASPYAADDGYNTAEDNDWASSDGNRHGHENEIGDSNDQHWQRSQKVHVPNWRCVRQLA